MKIRYENAIEDFVAFNRLHARHSPAYRWAIQKKLWLAAAVVWLYGVVAMLAYDEPVYLIGGGIGGAMVFLVLPGLVRRRNEHLVRKLYSEGANKGAIGPRQLEMIGNELIMKGPVSESKIQIQAIERVVVDGGYTLIYISAMSAYVIPHDSVTEGDPELFVEALKKRMPEVM